MHQTHIGDVNVINEGRVKPLKDTDDLVVKAPLRDLVVQKLVKKLDELGEGQNTRDIWLQGNSLRTDWLNRQQALLETFDEFVETIYDSTNDWSSTLHLPIVYTQCKTLHARFNAALLGIDPPFTVKARQGVNADRAQLVEQFMRYALMEWSNEYKGVEEVADRWIWSFITTGRGILKNRWHRSFTRYVDVVERQVPAAVITMQGPDGSLVAVPQMKTIEEEKEVVIETANCPVIEHVPNEDVLLIGSQDPQQADHVLHSVYYTASELWTLVDRGIFKREAVEMAIKSGESYRGSDAGNSIKEQQSLSSGMGYIDSTLDAQRYQVLERHSRIDVDGSGIASDIIMWVHVETGAILRATYLYRVCKLGLRPFFVSDFYLRNNGMPAGIPEILYSLAKEVDSMHNMSVDFGLISSMPFGFYRAASSTNTEKMPLEPGTLIPLDNPQSDVYFPNLGARYAFPGQEAQLLQQQIERVTSISDISLGMTTSQGAARTATGARALLGESSANLDIYIKRMNRGWASMLKHLFSMLEENVPDGMQFRLLGDDGSMYWETIQSREQLRGSWDFCLEANSANSNKSVTIEQANVVLQTVSNPFYMQAGISTPLNIYNAIKNVFMHQGVRDFSKYITKPQGQEQIWTPEQMANSILAGIDIKLSPQQDLQGFLEFFQHIVDNDELLGQFTEQQTLALAKKAQEAQQLMQAMQAQAAQVANQQQQASNASMMTSPGAAVSQSPQPTPQEAGGMASA
jgi:hypothetical protein